MCAAVSLTSFHEMRCSVDASRKPASCFSGTLLIGEYFELSPNSHSKIVISVGRLMSGCGLLKIVIVNEQRGNLPNLDSLTVESVYLYHRAAERLTA